MHQLKAVRQHHGLIRRDGGIPAPKWLILFLCAGFCLAVGSLCLLFTGQLLWGVVVLDAGVGLMALGAYGMAERRS